MKRLLIVATLLPVLVLSACGYGRTNSGGYISGDGLVHAIPESQRIPLTLTGTTLDGAAFDLASTRGKVTVINVWGAWCGECLTEAPLLQQAHTTLGDSVAFVGVDIRDTSVDQAKAYERNYGITYPSISSPDGKAMLAFTSYVSPRTIPATLILDTQGRPAMIIRGTIPSALTLTEAIGCVQNPAGAHCDETSA